MTSNYKQLALWACILFCSVVSYAQVPAGYYSSAEGLSGNTLQATLHNIIDEHTVKSYEYLWTAFGATDIKANGKVWDMYSDIPGGTSAYEYTYSTNQCSTTPGYEGACYNREHSFPKSWFGGEITPMYTDLHHLIPSDSYVNTMRSDLPYGEVSVPTFTSTNGSKKGSNTYPGYTGVVFEPIDEYKGDLARNYFYMATRYYGEDQYWTGSPMVSGSQLTSWAEAMLMEWHLADPVSAKEIARNNAVYGIQGNRNPFIDHPEYATYIWGDFAVEPTNHPADFSAHSITLSWEDATGVTLPDGYLIRMSSVGFGSITTPVDGTEVPAGVSDRYVSYGVESCVIGGLTPETTYYFMVYPYKGSGSAIDYKTDGTPVQVSLKAK
ncbi:MAG: endonuclease [Bacteroidales bacterium]|nr:endonuclease [Bacteroidales bacterium]